VIGPAVFDLKIAATMLGNGVRRIYTFNRADFARIAELEVLIP
jgi:predicted nucleic acid-binding protein